MLLQQIRRHNSPQVYPQAMTYPPAPPGEKFLTLLRHVTVHLQVREAMYVVHERFAASSGVKEKGNNQTLLIDIACFGGPTM